MVMHWFNQRSRSVSGRVTTGMTDLHVDDYTFTACDQTPRSTFPGHPSLGRHNELEVCGNDFLVPIPFPLPSKHSHSHFPHHLYSHFGQQLYIDYLKAEKHVYCVLNSKQNMKLQQKHC